MFGLGIDSLLGATAQKIAQKYLLKEQAQDLVTDGLEETATYNAAAEADAQRRMVNSPAGLVKSLAKIGGFVAGRSEETEDGTQITIGDPGTSDLADQLTGASGLQDLMRGDIGVGNTVDALGVAFDAGLPGPPVAPMLGAILPMNRVKDFAGSLADASRAIMTRGARESVEDFAGRTLGMDTPISRVILPGASEEAIAEVMFTGQPRTFRTLLDDLDAGAISTHFSDTAPDPWDIADLDRAMQDAIDINLLKAPADRAVAMPASSIYTHPKTGEKMPSVGSAYFPEKELVEGDPFGTFGIVDRPDAPGSTVIGLQTMVDPSTGRIEYFADMLPNRDLAGVAAHEIQHGVNKFVPKHIAKKIADNPTAMQNIENLLVGKYGVGGAEYYRRKGKGAWVDEGLAVMGETGAFDMLGGVEGISDLKEANDVFRNQLGRITAPSAPSLAYDYPTKSPALKQVNDQINNWGDRTGTIVFDTKRIR